MDAEPLLTQKEGESPTLQSFIDAGQLHHWLYHLIRPYIAGRILEVWSGEGTMASIFLQNGTQLHISDPHRSNYAALTAKLEKGTILKGIHRINLFDPDFSITHQPFVEKFNTIISLNATEKNAIEPLVLKNAKNLLKERGRVIILLPAQTVLYEESNEGLKELRRWNWQYIKTLLGNTGKIHHFFSISETPLSIQPSLYNQQVPSFHVSEGISFPRPGLYIIAMVRK
jgi:SAM-dependent methyltransferase